MKRRKGQPNMRKDNVQVLIHAETVRGEKQLFSPGRLFPSVQGILQGRILEHNLL